MTTPSLADDEAALARYALALADAIEAALPAWFDRCIGRHLALDELSSAEITGHVPDAAAPVASSYAADAQRASDETAAAVRELLSRDIEQQSIGPLEILRRAVSFPTQVLRTAGVAPVPRDDFAQRTFPDDAYDLTPASFGDVHESVHEPGLVWGAAKAHVHLRRRRERNAEPTAEPTADEAHPAPVVLCADLMDRSKISAALPHANFVRTPQALIQAAKPGSLVVVDLRRLDDVSVLSEVPGRVVAFGSHVDEAVLAQAKACGADALPRSVFFKRLASGAFS